MSALQIAQLNSQIDNLKTQAASPDERLSTFSKFVDMLGLQHQLNQLGRVGVPEYLAENHPWHYAIFGEAEETLGHIGWTWWKGWNSEKFSSYAAYLDRNVPFSDQNVQQAALEWIDQLHFLLSLVLQGGAQEWIVFRCARALADGLEVGGRHPATLRGETHLTTQRRLIMDLARTVTNVDTYYFDDNTWPTEFGGDLVHQIESGFLTVGRALGQMGVTEDRIYQTYVPKNVLNAFRWRDYRYQKGSYIKVWAGEEDSVYLQRFVEEHSKVAEDVSLVDYLNRNLEQRYSEAVEAGDPAMSAGK